MANVKVRLKDASNNVLHPETDWSVVQNKPSIFTYPVEAGTCIGDISGFRIFYAKGEFYVFVTAGIAEGNYTLGFATPGGTLNSGSQNEGPILAFFVNILDLRINSTGIVDDQHKRLNLTSGYIEPTNALVFRGNRSMSFINSLEEGGQVNVSINVDDRPNNVIAPVNRGSALCIGVFSLSNVAYDEMPYLMMVTKLA